MRRAISARKMVESTKTDFEHVIPYHPNFIEVIKAMRKKSVGGHIFKNEKARRGSKRYTNESLNIIWEKACKSVGESIDLYSGLKHSSCSQYINERGLSISDLKVHLCSAPLRPCSAICP
jgi:hypothetical protein